METASVISDVNTRQIESSIAALRELQPKMDELKRVANTYLSTVKNAILKKRTDYQVKLSQLRSNEEQLKSEIERNKSARQELLEELAKEMRRRNESSKQVEEMKIQQESIEKEKREFTAKLEEIELQITTKLRQVNEQQEQLRNQTAMVNGKLFQFEQLLGLRIENTGEVAKDISMADDDNHQEPAELIRFIFKNVDPEDFAREVSFVFDPVSVMVVSSEPHLPQEVYDEATSVFVNSKEIVNLWKFMRTSLQSKILETH